MYVDCLGQQPHKIYVKYSLFLPAELQPRWQLRQLAPDQNSIEIPKFEDFSENNISEPEMERGGRSRRQKWKKNPVKQPDLTNDDGGDTTDDSEGEEEHMETEATAMIRAGLKDIIKEIQDFKTELKAEFATFKQEIKKEMKEELEDFKKDINQRLGEAN